MPSAYPSTSQLSIIRLIISFESKRVFCKYRRENPDNRREAYLYAQTPSDRTARVRCRCSRKLLNGSKQPTRRRLLFHHRSTFSNDWTHVLIMTSFWTHFDHFFPCCSLHEDKTNSYQPFRYFSTIMPEIGCHFGKGTHLADMRIKSSLLRKKVLYTQT